jgi:DNA-binding NarL/FixJ family response regulator
MTEIKPTKVAVLDTDDAFRQGLCHFLNFSPGFKSIGTFDCPAGMLEQVIQYRPDVVLVDIDMAGIDGRAFIKCIKTYFPELPIIVLTALEDETSVFAVMQAGANGYLLKKTPPHQILEALKEATEGGVPMTPSVVQKIMHHFFGKAHITYHLTPKEKEVLQGLTRGLSYKLIAAELQICITTVRSHLKSIYEKLHVNSNVEAVAKAFRDDLV